MARFNPPPGWPPFPEGWTPPTGWRADPEWPSPPAGWQWWLADPPQHWWSWREQPPPRHRDRVHSVPIGATDGAATARSVDRATICGWIINVGGVVAIAGSLMPWFTVLGLQVAGTNGDGLVTLIAGALIVAGGAAVAMAKRKWIGVVTLLLAVLAVAVAAYDLTKGTSFRSGSGLPAAVDIGPWITAAGGIVAAVTAIVQLGAVGRLADVQGGVEAAGRLKMAAHAIPRGAFK